MKTQSHEKTSSKPQPTGLSDEKLLRVKVAELCGWKCERAHDLKNTLWQPPHYNDNPQSMQLKWTHELPDYCRDLNAMHEAEKMLTFEKSVVYRALLQANSDGRKATFDTCEAAMCHATARQRAEAFVKNLTIVETPEERKHDRTY